MSSDIRNTRQLAQIRPSGTSNTTLYAPSSDTKTAITLIRIVNTTGTNARYRLFHDDNGSVGDESTALDFDIKLKKNTSINQQFRKNELTINGKTGGKLICRTDTGLAITFTVYGLELLEQ